MRRGAFAAAVFLFLIAPLDAAPVEVAHPQTDQVAHGAEKEAHQAAHPAEDHGAGHAAPKTYFGIPGWLLKLLNMIAFVAVLVYLTKGPVGTAFRDRNAQIRAQFAEAQARRARAESMASEIQGKLTELDRDVESILARAREDGERQKEEMLAAARAESEKVLAAARTEIDLRLKRARQELTELAAELAATRAHSLLAASLTDADRKKLFRESVERVAEVQS